MQAVGYDRYGLTSNPFRDLSSESIEDIDIFHVNQDFDRQLRIVKEEIFEKSNKAVIIVLGTQGVGKTERLLLCASEAKKNNFFYILRDINVNVRWNVEGIIRDILKNKKGKKLSQPQWYKNLSKISKKLSNYNYDAVGRAIAFALNENAPSYLLLNDLQNFANNLESLKRFMHVFHSIINNINQGVLVMVSSDYDYFIKSIKQYPSVDQRINQKLVIQPLSDKEANLMIAKRMLDKRLVDSIDPLYPFDEKSIELINNEAKGNPRELLRVASFLIDNATQKKAMIIEEELTNELLSLHKNKQLNIDFEKETLQPQIPLQKEIMKKRPVKNPISLNDISMKVPTNSSAKNPGFHSDIVNEPEDFQISENQDDLENDKEVSNDQICNDVSIMKKEPNNMNETNKISGEKQKRSIKVKCPKCAKIFTFEVSREKEKLRCPNMNCDFVGIVKLKR